MVISGDEEKVSFTTGGGAIIRGVATIQGNTVLCFYHLIHFIMAEGHRPSFRLIRSQRGAKKLIEGGFIYGKQRRIW